MSVIGSNILAGASGQAGAAPAGYAIERSLRFDSSASSYLSRTPSSAGNRRTFTYSIWVKRNQTGASHNLFGIVNAATQERFQFGTNDKLYFIYNQGTSNLSTDAVFRDLSAWYHIVLVVDTNNSTAADRLKIYINGVQQTLTGTSLSSGHQFDFNNTVQHRIGSFNDGTTNYHWADIYLADVHFIDGQALAPTDFGESDANGVWQPIKYTFDTVLTIEVGTPSYPSDFTTTGNKTSDQTALSFTSWSGSYTGAITKIFKTSDDSVFDLNISLAGGTTDRYLWYSDNLVDWTYIGNTNPNRYYLLSGHKYYATSEGSASTTLSAQPNGANSFHLDFSDNSSNAALGTDSSGNNNDWTVNNITANAPGLATAKQGMDVVTYTGNGTSQTISGLQFSPDFVWVKQRNTTRDHRLANIISGTGKDLRSNATNAEVTDANGITAFNSDGFSVGSSTGWNQSSGTYVAWCWKAGGTASSNTDGSITSQVSANTTYGFSVVTWTGTTDATVGHGLNAAPALVITKSRNNAVAWRIWSSEFSNAASDFLGFDTNAVTTYPGAYWGSITSTTLGFKSNTFDNNKGNMVAYCWSEVAGFSKFGSYESADPADVTVNVGFKPRFVMIKSADYSSTTTSWMIYDSARLGTGTMTNALMANKSAGEGFRGDGTSTGSLTQQQIEFTDTGFIVQGGGSEINEQTGNTYIYAAFADKPPGENVDSLFDSPTNGTQTDTGLGGQVSGNYATWNPLNANGSGISNGNLDLVGSSNFVQSTIMVDSGKYYFEFTKNGNGDNQFGIAYGGSSAGSTGFRRVWRDNNGSPVWLTDGSNAGSGTALSCAVGDVIGVALDMDNNAVYFSKNGTYMNSGDPTSGSSKTGAIWIDLSGQSWGPNAGSNANGVDCSLNTGQRAFAYTAPTGYKALCTTNLADPTLADGSDYMDVVTRAGGGVNQSFTTLSPGLVWEKRRDSASSHYLFDVNRGNDKYLSSNTTAAEGSQSGAFTFNANSYVVSSGFDWPSSASVVDWVWDAGHPATAATGAVSFDGTGDWLSIPTSSDFSIGTSDDFTFEAFIYPTSVSDTTAFGIGTSAGFAYRIISGSPYLYVASSGGILNTGTIVAKKWTHIAVTRNSGTLYSFIDGVLAGSVANSGSFDGTQENFIGAANLTAAASPGYLFTGQISNVRWVKGTALYTSNFTPPTAELTNVTNTKLLCCQSTTSATAAAVAPGTITANGDASATTFNPLDAFSVNGTGYATTSAAGITEGTIALTGASVNRSAGFSIGTYTGLNNSTDTIGHGLNAAPEFFIIKSRSSATAGNWFVWHKSLTNNGLILNETTAQGSHTSHGRCDTFTSTTFRAVKGTVSGSYGAGPYDFVFYAFTGVNGYSSFGSYTGNGSTDGPFVYTGHRSRWLMVKRTDTSGYPWVIVDALRDGYNVTYKWLEPNSSSAEQSVQPVADVDFLSNGFKMRGGGNTTNQSAGTYIYAAFAENPFKYARAR